MKRWIVTGCRGFVVRRHAEAFIGRSPSAGTEGSAACKGGERAPGEAPSGEGGVPGVDELKEGARRKSTW